MAERRQTRADQVRSAVDEALAAAAGQAQITRERAQDLVDELGGAAGRMREALDELRPAAGDELRDLHAQMRALERRVAALEGGPAKSKPATKKSAAKKKA